MKRFSLVGTLALVLGLPAAALAFGPVIQFEGQRVGGEQVQTHVGAPAVLGQSIHGYVKQGQAGPAGVQGESAGFRASQFSAGGGTSTQVQGAGGSQFQLQVGNGGINLE